MYSYKHYILHILAGKSVTATNQYSPVPSDDTDRHGCQYSLDRVMTLTVTAASTAQYRATTLTVTAASTAQYRVMELTVRLQLLRKLTDYNLYMTAPLTTGCCAPRPAGVAH